MPLPRNTLESASHGPVPGETGTRPHPAVKLHIPAPLREYCGGQAELLLDGSNVRGLLRETERQYPALYRALCDETGRVRRHVNLFVNTDHIRDRHGLDTALTRGDLVTVLPAVSGG